MSYDAAGWCLRLCFRVTARPICAHQGKRQHGYQDDDEARGGLQNGAFVLGKNREGAVDELDVDPVHEQRGFAELNDGAETHLGQAPAAPGVDGEENDQQDAATHQEKVGAGMPVVVGTIELDAGRVEFYRKETGKNACPT